jgi:uncharacterized protein (TIGR03437 family)
MKLCGRVRFLLAFSLAMLLVASGLAQTSRIPREINSGSSVKLSLNTSPRALTRLDLGLAPLSPLSHPVNTFTAAIDGVKAPLEFVGLAPLVGVAQANITLTNVTAGNHSLTISATTSSGTLTSNTATFSVGGN